MAKQRRKERALANVNRNESSGRERRVGWKPPSSQTNKQDQNEVEFLSSTKMSMGGFAEGSKITELPEWSLSTINSTAVSSQTNITQRPDLNCFRKNVEITKPKVSSTLSMISFLEATPSNLDTPKFLEPLPPKSKKGGFGDTFSVNRVPDSLHHSISALSSINNCSGTGQNMFPTFGTSSSTSSSISSGISGSGTFLKPRQSGIGSLKVNTSSSSSSYSSSSNVSKSGRPATATNSSWFVKGSKKIPEGVTLPKLSEESDNSEIPELNWSTSSVRLRKTPTGTPTSASVSLTSDSSYNAEKVQDFIRETRNNLKGYMKGYAVPSSSSLGSDSTFPSVHEPDPTWIPPESFTLSGSPQSELLSPERKKPRRKAIRPKAPVRDGSVPDRIAKQRRRCPVSPDSGNDLDVRKSKAKGNGGSKSKRNFQIQCLIESIENNSESFNERSEVYLSSFSSSNDCNPECQDSSSDIFNNNDISKSTSENESEESMDTGSRRSSKSKSKNCSNSLSEDSIKDSSHSSSKSNSKNYSDFLSDDSINNSINSSISSSNSKNYSNSLSVKSINNSSNSSTQSSSNNFSDSMKICSSSSNSNASNNSSASSSKSKHGESLLVQGLKAQMLKLQEENERMRQMLIQRHCPPPDLNGRSEVPELLPLSTALETNQPRIAPPSASTALDRVTKRRKPQPRIRLPKTLNPKEKR